MSQRRDRSRRELLAAAAWAAGGIALAPAFGQPSGKAGLRPVRLAFAADPLPLDVVRPRDFMASQAAHLVGDSLVWFDRELKLVPRVARRWAWSRDHLELTFQLRDGVRWHDGPKPLQEFEREVGKSRETGRDAGSGAGRRSVLFIHNCYYNYFYLDAALRRRGWDAISASIENPNGPNAKFYHGEDLNLFDPDPERFQRRRFDFFAEVEDRFGMVHFQGVGCMSIFPAYFDQQRSYDGLPVDFLRLRQ